MAKTLDYCFIFTPVFLFDLLFRQGICVAQIGLELSILLSQNFEFWGYRSAATI